MKYYVIEISHAEEIDSRKLHEELLGFAQNNTCNFSTATIVFGEAHEEKIQQILTICENYGKATLKQDRVV